MHFDIGLKILDDYSQNMNNKEFYIIQFGDSLPTMGVKLTSLIGQVT